MDTIDQLGFNTIRTLSIDAVQKANSGHPGTPMGMAPTVYTLWQDVLNYDPAEPAWANRDRFVLSVGHASMLLYSVLHLAGVVEIDQHDKKTGLPAVSLDDIKAFRQFGSKCPGHPESHLTTGVEATTGPLGQGLANSVGMTIAREWLASYFNRPGFPVIDHHVFALSGDGCMMEGISSEAASLAGHLKLANLTWIYDSNRISIEGSTDLAFTEDVGARFLTYGWHVLRVRDANNIREIEMALNESKTSKDMPTLIVIESHIGFGAPKKQDTKSAHGEPLGEEEVRGAKKAYGWPEDAQFYVPDEVYQAFRDRMGARGGGAHAEWRAMFERYRAEYPDLAESFERMQRRELPEDWASAIPNFPADAKGIASRDSGGKVENAIATKLPWLIGGAADLSPSTKTNLTGDNAASFQPGSYGGRNLHFGVREHAMGAVVNGLTLSRLRAFGSTFLIFSDYMRNPIRLSALMEIPAIWVFTHDSIGVGEDGPTHQPIEQLLSLRAIPGLTTIRPCDANEAAEAWKMALGVTHNPTCLIMSRQNLPTLDRTKYGAASGLAKGAYVLQDPEEGTPEVILIATGSEVAMTLEAAGKLTAEGKKVRVVSMPSWELFEHQDEAYRGSVLPPSITARVSVEQSATIGWERYVGLTGAKIGMNSFGASAPMAVLQQQFGFTADKIAEAARKQIAL